MKNRRIRHIGASPEKRSMTVRDAPMLEIFVTHWVEGWDICEKGFDILGLQRGVDWDRILVTLVNDGTEADGVPAFPNSLFARYPFHFRQTTIPHGGIAATRNWCLDHSNAEWIKFNDCDDMFSGVYSLRNLMDVLTKGQDFDLVWFDMYGEETDGMTRYLKKDRDPVVIHNKCFRRSFLREHDIRFNEELTWCEDSAFLAIVEMEIDHQRIGKLECEMPIYAWLARNGSLCNRDEIRYQNALSFFKRHRYVQDEFLRHGHMGPYYTMSVRIMCDSYRVLALENYPEDTSEHEMEVAAYYHKHRDDFFHVSKADFELVMRAVQREGGKEIRKEAFTAWLRELRAKYAGFFPSQTEEQIN